MTRVTSEIRIDASRDKVWNVVADLGSVSVWNPALADSHYTSEVKEGVGASRHCDFPDEGYVKERATEWKPGEGYTLDIYEGTVPFASAQGSLSLVDDGDGTIVTFAIEYDLKADVPVDPQEVERQNREDLFPLIVKGGEKVYHCGGGIVYHRHDEKGLNWEPDGIRSGAGVRSSGVSQESTGSSDTWEAALCRLCLRR